MPGGQRFWPTRTAVLPSAFSLDLCHFAYSSSILTHIVSQIHNIEFTLIFTFTSVQLHIRPYSLSAKQASKRATTQLLSIIQPPLRQFRAIPPLSLLAIGVQSQQQDLSHTLAQRLPSPSVETLPAPKSRQILGNLSHQQSQIPASSPMHLPTAMCLVPVRSANRLVEW